MISTAKVGHDELNHHNIVVTKAARHAEEGQTQSAISLNTASWAAYGYLLLVV